MPIFKKNPGKYESYKKRRVYTRKKAAIKKGVKPAFLNLKTQGIRDAISDFRKGKCDPNMPMNNFEDHTYSVAYRETMRALMAKPAKLKKNPAPAPRERSDRLHAIRKALVKDMNAAKRNGNLIRYDYMATKIRKLDRIIYAPRNVKRRK